MARRLVIIAVLILTVLVGAPAAQPRPTMAQDSPTTVNVEFVLDVSGSMAEVIDTGETRMDAAKRVMREVIAAIPNQENINVGLRIYGFLGDNSDATKAISCDSSELIVPIAGVDKQAILNQIDALQPTGWTPLATSLERAGGDFQPGENVTNAVVLITDGVETCDGDPCNIASQLHAEDIQLITHVVGFGLAPEEQATLQCIADGGGGMLIGAANAAELSSALFDILEQLEVVQGVGFVAGTALGILPDGEPGELSVLAIGPYDGNVLPIVVRNNTGADIIRITAVATAKNPAGQVIASGNDQMFNPNLVRAGGVAFGYAYFDGIALPPDTTFEVALQSKLATDDQFENRRDLEIIEASTLEGRVVGTMSNVYDTKLDGPVGVAAVCFDDAGNLLQHLQSFSSAESVAPDETLSFQVDNYQSASCPLFLVAASAWDNTFGPDNDVEPPGDASAAPTAAPAVTNSEPATGSPAACGDLTSAESVLTALQMAGMEAGEFISYTAENDPNELLGRPGQYISKVNFTIPSIAPTPVNFDVLEGGSIEVFANETDAISRTAYVETFTQAISSAVEYDFREGTVLLRLSRSLTPDQAEAYHQLLVSLVAEGCAAPKLG